MPVGEARQIDPTRRNAVQSLGQGGVVVAAGTDGPAIGVLGIGGQQRRVVGHRGQRLPGNLAHGLRRQMCLPEDARHDAKADRGDRQK